MPRSNGARQEVGKQMVASRARWRCHIATTATLCWSHLLTRQDFGPIVCRVIGGVFATHENGVTLSHHTETSNDIAGAVRGEGREGVLLEHLPDDLDLALGLLVRLLVDPDLALLPGKVGLHMSAECVGGRGRRVVVRGAAAPRGSERAEQ